MKRMIMMTLMMIAISSAARQEAGINSILRVIGVMSIEDADAEEVDRLIQLMHHPIPLDKGGIPLLESSGLFSPYQVMSLKDYISRHGDVLSMAELAAVDGFSEQYVDVIRPFVRPGGKITSDGQAEKRLKSKLKVDVDLKGAFKVTEPEVPEWNGGFRANIDVKGAVQAAVAATRKYDEQVLNSAGLALAYRFGKVVIGDFNARFGQGLCLWNTVSFSSLTSPSAFMKRPSGVTLSHSYTGAYAMTGMAGDVNLGAWKLSAMLSLPGIRQGTVLLQPAVNLVRYFRFGHVSATHVMSFSDVTRPYFRIPHMKSSFDASMCFCGVNLFSELAYDWVKTSAAFVTGMESGIGECLRIASLVRYLPASDEHGAALSGEFSSGRHSAVFSVDAAYDLRRKEGEAKRLQFKGQMKWRWSMAEWLYSELRLSERYRTWGLPFRTDLRADFCFDTPAWTAAVRFNLLDCDGLGMLGYAEAGYRLEHLLKVFLRQGIFRIDDWDDRIYVYERDSPGNFNVPAFYGRGMWSSLYLSSRPVRWLTTYLRVSYVSYFLMREKKKPGKAELKLQLSLHF